LAYSERRECFVDTDTDAIVRTNTAVRDASLKTGREGGWLTINDCLRKLNKPTIGPEGDTYLVPLNHNSVGGTAGAAGALNDGLRMAIDEAMKAAATRSLRLQANAAQRAAKKPVEFAGWLDEFAREHRRLATDVLLPFAKVAVAALKLDETPGQLADRVAEALVAESRQRLQQVSQRAAGDQLAAAVEAEVAEWEQRSTAVVVRTSEAKK
ncbi:MAG TPA: hypothetical protein VGE52_02720, partial [Pirellulales bacterium]